ncbi:hypothetical protein BGX34_002331 [Mortierella sp. NVP85]|nr:hypothetical protein BGX34_002331 [Mortierella sp. NVP85]
MNQDDDLPRAAELARRNQPGADGDGDQDMDTDDNPRASSSTSSGNNSISDSSTMVATASSSPSSSNYNTVPSVAAVGNTTSEIVPDYNKLSVPRESLMAMVPRTHRHRVYAAQGGLPLQYYNHYNQYPHHYTLRHHLHYNPFTYRKFPPHQHWAASAQRDYHWKTLGIADLFPDRRREGAAAAAGAGPPPPPPPGAAGQVVLRSTAGNAGVNKTVFRSRLPVHLRHITARANRRAAIFTNPFREGSGEDAMSTEQDTMTGPSARGRTGRAAAGGGGEGGMQGEEGESGHHLMTSNLGMENLSISSSSSSSSFPPRKRIVEWRRLKDDYGKIMRLASNDIITTTGSSSTSSPSSSLASGRRGNNRVWTNQRGGLANILQAKQQEDNSSGSGPGSGAGPNSSVIGSGASTVDRLVEEMNKWSV